MDWLAKPITRSDILIAFVGYLIAKTIILCGAYAYLVVTGQ